MKNILRTALLSFYSPAIYREVGQLRQGLGFFYLLVIISLLSLPLLLVLLIFSFTVTMEWPYDFRPIIDQVPTIHITNGEVSIDAPEPYYIRGPEGDPIVIIDTTRPVLDWVQALPDQQAVVIGKREFLFYNERKGETRIRQIPADTNMVIDRETVYEVAQNVLGWLWLMPLLFVPFFILFQFLYRVIQMLLYALPGLLMSRLFRTNLNYTDCVRVASVAITPIIAFSMLPGWFIHLSGWVYFVAAMGYLGFGIKANAA